MGECPMESSLEFSVLTLLQVNIWSRDLNPPTLQSLNESNFIVIIQMYNETLVDFS